MGRILEEAGTVFGMNYDLEIKREKKEG